MCFVPKVLYLKSGKRAKKEPHLKKRKTEGPRAAAVCGRIRVVSKETKGF